MAAPSGGGGGGGPVGFANSFTGPAEAIEAMGNGVWAGWSGLKQPNNSTVEAFNFLSPNKGLIVDMGWFVNFDDLSANTHLRFSVSLNGNTVIFVKGETDSNADFAESFPFVIPSFVIPSQSEVIALVGTDNNADTANYITLVGKEI